MIRENQSEMSPTILFQFITASENNGADNKADILQAGLADEFALIVWCSNLTSSAVIVLDEGSFVVFRVHYMELKMDLSVWVL